MNENYWGVNRRLTYTVVEHGTRAYNQSRAQPQQCQRYGDRIKHHGIKGQKWGVLTGGKDGKGPGSPQEKQLAKSNAVDNRIKNRNLTKQRDKKVDLAAKLGVMGGTLVAIRLAADKAGVHSLSDKSEKMAVIMPVLGKGMKIATAVSLAMRLSRSGVRAHDNIVSSRPKNADGSYKTRAQMSKEERTQDRKKMLLEAGKIAGREAAVVASGMVLKKVLSSPTIQQGGSKAIRRVYETLLQGAGHIDDGLATASTKMATKKYNASMNRIIKNARKSGLSDKAIEGLIMRMKG